MANLSAQQQELFTKCGLDPSKIAALPWTQIIALVMELIKIISGGGTPSPVMKAALAGCSMNDLHEHLRNIALCQESLAKCQQQCLDCCPAE